MFVFYIRKYYFNWNLDTFVATKMVGNYAFEYIIHYSRNRVILSI